jgi:hypothetical protein
MKARKLSYNTNSEMIKNVLDFSYEVGEDVGREVLDKSIYDDNFWVIENNDKVVGVIIYKILGDSAWIVHLAYVNNDVAERLLHIVKGDNVEDYVIYVKESNVERCVLMRDIIKAKFVGRLTNYNGWREAAYEFRKVLKEIRSKAHV